MMQRISETLELIRMENGRRYGRAFNSKLMKFRCSGMTVIVAFNK